MTSPEGALSAAVYFSLTTSKNVSIAFYSINFLPLWMGSMVSFSKIK